MADKFIWFAFIAAIIGILYGIYIIWWILKKSQGTKEMKKIAGAIQEGAAAFLKRQYTTVAVVAFIIFFILFFALGVQSALGFLIGAALSALAGITGMLISVRTNVRVANAAKKGLFPALNLAFKGGAVTGILTGSLGLLALSVTWLIFKDVEVLIALGFGGSLISIFARLGGGIYTKGADVGADLVGKVEAGIPEDDPRNPAVIADNVGDNVGDCAGMAADIFETYIVSIAAAMILSSLLSDNQLYFVLPLALGGIGIIASILASLWLKKSKSIMTSLYSAFGIAVVIIAAGFYLINHFYIHQINWFWSGIVGVAVTILLFIITEYYTSTKFSPVQKIAESSKTGAATNIISGIATSLYSTALPALVIAGAILTSYNLAGLTGIAMSVVAMLSLAPMIVSIDSYGPITDNAGGIAEMTGMEKSVRETTDALDAVGNTTKAVTKAYAIGSAGLAALVLFSVFNETIQKITNKASAFDISDPHVLVGFLVGILTVYLFAALALEAVGKAAQSVVAEVRRQFKEIKGILQGTGKPEYDKAVDIVTKSALKQMIVPSLLPIVIPIIFGFLFGEKTLAGILIGSIAGGLFLAISMTTGGAAWDNAKKYIEEGHLGGKGSPAHKAAVVGDTVGDPYKDTAGPAINPVIKVINIVALLIIRFIIK
jgi:K(+)-stimulated pyrophosphate-energized sodium pump